MSHSAVKSKKPPLSKRLWHWVRHPGHAFKDDHPHDPSVYLTTDGEQLETQAAAPYHYTKPELEAAQLIWGHALIGPCSANELASITQWLDIDAHMQVAILGAGLGGLGLALSRICPSKITCFEQSDTLIALSPERKLSRLRSFDSITFKQELAYDRVIIDGFGHLGGAITPFLPIGAKLLSPKGKMLIRAYCLDHPDMSHDALYQKALKDGTFAAPLPSLNRLKSALRQLGLGITQYSDMQDIHAAAIEMRWTKGTDLLYSLGHKAADQPICVALLKQASMWQQKMQLMANGRFRAIEILVEKQES